jgi:hypothetical protein
MYTIPLLALSLVPAALAQETVYGVYVSFDNSIRAKPFILITD